MKDYTIKTETQGKIFVAKKDSAKDEKPRVFHNNLDKGFIEQISERILLKFRARQEWKQTSVVGVKG